MSWGERPEDFTGEPKNVFVNFLIWNLKNISTFLFYNRQFAMAIGPLMETIASLDSESQKKLESQYKALENFWLGKKPYEPMDLETIYREVVAYLHETYLREVRFAKPLKPSKDKMGVPEF